MLPEKTPIPTQMLDLRSVDFGPEQETPGRRIRGLGAPPPTGLIRPDMLLRDDRQVMAEARAERRTPSALAEHARMSVQSNAIALQEAAAERLPSVLRAVTLVLLGMRDSFAETWDSFLTWLGDVRGSKLGRVRTVSEATVLRVRAAGDGRLAVHVPGGTRLLVYPEYGARIGWMLARTVDGEVGFIETKYLA